MKFEYSEEQLMLQEMISKYLDENYDFEHRQKIVTGDATYDRGLWNSAAELGWLSIPFDEDLGGFGGSAVDIALMFQLLGKRLTVEPFLETLVLGGGLLKRLNTQGAQAERIETLIGGGLQCAVAHEDAGAAFDPASTTTTATPNGDGYMLNGTKAVVSNAADADVFLVTAQLPDDTMAIFLLAQDEVADHLTRYPTIDGFNAAELNLAGLQVSGTALLGQGDAALAALDATFADGIVAAAAQQVGIMQVLLDLTLEYTQQRKQFGVPIATFQVLQHKMADMFAALELTQSLLYVATISLKAGTANSAQLVNALKIQADKATSRVAHDAFQLHGAMATTDECAVGHYLKRHTMLSQRFGGTAYRVDTYADQSRDAQVCITEFN